MVIAASVFADATIKYLVENFDFRKMNVANSTHEDYFHVGLAPSYGKLQDGLDSKALHRDLLVMTAAALKDLEAIKADDRSFDTVLSAFMQNTLMEPDGDAVYRSDRLMKSKNALFKFDGSPNAAIVMAWFKALISDNDVLESTSLKIGQMADIVAQTGVAIDSFEAILKKKESHAKDMVDVGVLCFPDANHSFFQLYRIKLRAWSTSKRTLGYQEDSNGIVGEYISRKFKPRESVMSQIDEETKQAAVEQALRQLKC